MTGEQIYETVNKFLWDKKCLTAVSRAYAGYHQIYCAILEHKGDNNYLTERKGIIFGV